MAMTLVSTVVVGTSAPTSLEFTNIPQTGTDLLLLFSGRTTAAGQNLVVSFNGTSSSSNWQRNHIQGDGSAVAGGEAADSNLNNAIVPSSFTADTFSNCQFYISNYRIGLRHRLLASYVTENRATLSYQRIQTSRWSVDTAITSISLSNASGFAQYTTAYLYIIS